MNVLPSVFDGLPCCHGECSGVAVGECAGCGTPTCEAHAGAECATCALLAEPPACDSCGQATAGDDLTFCPHALDSRDDDPDGVGCELLLCPSCRAACVCSFSAPSLFAAGGPAA